LIETFTLHTPKQNIMKTETNITARSIKHRLNEDHYQRVLEAKKHRTHEEDARSITLQLHKQKELRTVKTVMPCN